MPLAQPIHHTFAPHVDREYLRMSLAKLRSPWRWKEGEGTWGLRAALEEHFAERPFLFASGRQALLAALKTLELKEGDEVIVQGYTCIAVPNAIHAAGALPVYVDIEKDTLNIDPAALKEAITPHSRAVICQHTFGIPADTVVLRKICEEHGLALIEDCAHVIPDATGPREVGFLGDYVFLSFGRDKAVSGIAGGALFTPHAFVRRRLERLEDEASPFPKKELFQLLLYAAVYMSLRPLYGVGILGKALLRACRSMGMLLPILTQEEKEGTMSPILQHLPEPCAALALHSFRKLHDLNDHRRRLTRLYLEKAQSCRWDFPRDIHGHLPLQKFPLYATHAEGIRKKLRRKNIHLDDGWTGCVICPPGSNFMSASYVPGSDPVAEDTAQMILNLPTHPTMTLEQGEILLEELETVMVSSSNHDRHAIVHP